MSQTLTQTTAKRLLGLPAVARLMMFARHEGPAVLVSTTERLALFRQSGVFAEPASVNPTLSDWPDKRQKVVLDLNSALRPFPVSPERYALTLTLGQEYPREAFLAQLVSFGFARDELPGFVVRGDTVTVYLDAEDEEKALRLEFFGDELDTLTLSGEAVESYVLAPLETAELDDAEDAWTSRLLEHLPGPVFLDSSELFAGETDPVQLAWLWEHLSAENQNGREVVSFGRDPLTLPDEKSALEPLGYYRGKLSTFAKDAKTWLEGGYSVTLLLRFERTGRYLQEKILEGVETTWANEGDGASGTARAGRRRGHARRLPRSGRQRDRPDRRPCCTAIRARGPVVRWVEKTSGAARARYRTALGRRLSHSSRPRDRALFGARAASGFRRDPRLSNSQIRGGGQALPAGRTAAATCAVTPAPPTTRRASAPWAPTSGRGRANGRGSTPTNSPVSSSAPTPSGRCSRAWRCPPTPSGTCLSRRTAPFVLTPDQKSAVQATWRDMAREVPMDRLISGDVGFGKTEVAIRAAHRAVGHGKQVAMLVPTTVLASQHFETYAERFAGLAGSCGAALAFFEQTVKPERSSKGLKTVP